MRINSNEIRISTDDVFSVAKKTSKKGRVNTVFNKVCEKSPFVSSIRTDVKESLGAFLTTRREIVDYGAEQLAKQQNNGIVKRIAKFIANQSKGLIKGASAMFKKAGPIPALFATAGFCTAFPGGTSAGLTIGVIIKNVLKILKNTIM